LQCPRLLQSKSWGASGGCLPRLVNPNYSQILIIASVTKYLKVSRNHLLG
jgi:hypothetical protein